MGKVYVITVTYYGPTLVHDHPNSYNDNESSSAHLNHFLRQQFLCVFYLWSWEQKVSSSVYSHRLLLRRSLASCLEDLTSKEVVYQEKILAIDKHLPLVFVSQNMKGILMGEKRTIGTESISIFYSFIRTCMLPVTHRSADFLKTYFKNSNRVR